MPPTLDWFEHGFKGGREGTLWYYRAIAEAFARLLPGRLANELTIAVAAMEQLSGA